MIKGIKICGISDIDTLNYIIKHKRSPKFVGFISNYKKSKRYVNFDTLTKLTSVSKNNVKFVSVLVNPTNVDLEKINKLPIDYFQLYDVNPERTLLIKNKYKKKIISALTIETSEDVKKYVKYQNISDIILFDSKGYEISMGFDHSLLKNIPNNFEKMIAGNINFQNIPILGNMDYFIDLSGSLENGDGKKDLQKIDNFLKSI